MLILLINEPQNMFPLISVFFIIIILLIMPCCFLWIGFCGRSWVHTVTCFILLGVAAGFTGHYDQNAASTPLAFSISVSDLPFSPNCQPSDISMHGSLKYFCVLVR